MKTINQLEQESLAPVIEILLINDDNSLIDETIQSIKEQDYPRIGIHLRDFCEGDYCWDRKPNYDWIVDIPGCMAFPVVKGFSKLQTLQYLLNCARNEFIFYIENGQTLENPQVLNKMFQKILENRNIGMVIGTSEGFDGDQPGVCFLARTEILRRTGGFDYGYHSFKYCLGDMIEHLEAKGYRTASMNVTNHVGGFDEFDNEEYDIKRLEIRSKSELFSRNIIHIGGGDDILLNTIPLINQVEKPIISGTASHVARMLFVDGVESIYDFDNWHLFTGQTLDVWEHKNFMSFPTLKQAIASVHGYCHHERYMYLGKVNGMSYDDETTNAVVVFEHERQYLEDGIEFMRQLLGAGLKIIKYPYEDLSSYIKVIADHKTWVSMDPNIDTIGMLVGVPGFFYTKPDNEGNYHDKTFPIIRQLD